MFSGKHAIIEYLYIDQARLNSYFEQISDPVAYDKVPHWKVALGLTGPKTEAMQARPGRAYTRHEKLKKLLTYLKDRRQLSTRRLAHLLDEETQFTIESMDARRAHIPARKGIPNFDGLNIWVSPKSDPQPKLYEFVPDPGALFLIEDYQCDDDNIWWDVISGYSSLLILVSALRTKIADTVLGREIADADSIGLPEGLSSSFTSDPIETLLSMGAKFGPPRRIRSLYRVRATCLDHGR